MLIQSECRLSAHEVVTRIPAVIGLGSWRIVDKALLGLVSINMQNVESAGA